MKESISRWIEQRLRLKVNEGKSGSGGVSGRKFLGFSFEPEGSIQIASKSIERFKDRVRELWDARQSKTNKQMRDQWNQWLKGWVGYFRIGERKPVAYLESWIRRRIRCYDWQRWHNAKGRCAKLSKLGVKPEKEKAGRSSRGAWRMAKHPAMHTALSDAAQRRAKNPHANPTAGLVRQPRCNRRMRTCMSGGVGALTGAIPSERPDRFRRTKQGRDRSRFVTAANKVSAPS